MGNDLPSAATMRLEAPAATCAPPAGAGRDGLGDTSAATHALTVPGPAAGCGWRRRPPGSSAPWRRSLRVLCGRRVGWSAFPGRDVRASTLIWLTWSELLPFGLGQVSPDKSATGFH